MEDKHLMVPQYPWIVILFDKLNKFEKYVFYNKLKHKFIIVSSRRGFQKKELGYDIWK